MQKQSLPGKKEKPHRLPDAAFGMFGEPLD
jgi:hypothetical protein